MEVCFSQIPKINMEILNQLNDEDLDEICKTYICAKRICMTEEFWIRRILAKYKNLDLKTKGKISWKEYYFSLKKRNSL